MKPIRAWVARDKALGNEIDIFSRRPKLSRIGLFSSYHTFDSIHGDKFVLRPGQCVEVEIREVKRKRVKA